jgi:hypothetical protein
MDQCLQKPLVESYSWYSFIIAYRERQYIDYYKILLNYQSEDLERLRQARSDRIDLLEGHISTLLKQLIRDRPSNINTRNFQGLSKLNLEELFIDSNMLEVIASLSFPDLIELKLGKNNLNYFYHNSYGSILFANIKMLDLSGNSFRYNELETILSYANKLEKLILNNCSLYQSSRHFSVHLPSKLRFLSLENSGINFESIRYLCDSQSNDLTELNLSNNNLSLLVDQNLSKCKLINLATLRLSNTGMTSIKWLINTNLPSLKVLDISHNRINYKEVQKLLEKVNLKSLDLSHNNLGNSADKILAYFQSITLEYLGLRGNDIDDIGAKLIADTDPPNLKVLDLRGNKIGAEGTAAFMKGKLKLDYLYLNNN